MSAEELQDAIAKAARGADKHLQLLEMGGQAPDHPVHPAIPETRYLKAYFCRVTDEFKVARMLTYPHINPVAISIGPCSASGRCKVHWYGIMYLIGFVAAGGWRATARACRVDLDGARHR